MVRIADASWVIATPEGMDRVPNSGLAYAASEVGTYEHPNDVAFILTDLGDTGDHQRGGSS